MKDTFSTNECNISPVLSLSCSASSFNSNILFYSGYKTGALTSSPNITIHSLSYSYISMFVRFLFISMFIPRNVCLFPLTTDKSSRCFFIYSMMFEITAVFVCDKFSSSTYQVVMHFVPSIFWFATNFPYRFISKHIPSRAVNKSLYHNNAELVQP